ncbi:hypothetical protein LZZ98_09385 [Acinetobacter sp. SM34]|uniref:hypothetical protein n=1 Tax=Acinetobacter sp. SM34 TaxID=1301620 RepID=UPI001EDC2EC2|nr:hypothetical protein [Acinetobacter sp. SM34]MCG2608738.1 hypothetical protein [Acinetobacter sp. SM34]
MKFYHIFILIILCSIQAHATTDYFCLTDGNKSILLVPKNYPDFSTVKYYPYLKDIKVSKTIQIYKVDMGENAHPEIYRTMNEIINNKITGKYTFMSQGYLIYYATYYNLKTKKKTEFSREYELKLKGVNCL